MATRSAVHHTTQHVDSQHLRDLVCTACSVVHDRASHRIDKGVWRQGCHGCHELPCFIWNAPGGSKPACLLVLDKLAHQRLPTWPQLEVADAPLNVLVLRVIQMAIHHLAIQEVPTNAVVPTA